MTTQFITYLTATTLFLSSCSHAIDMPSPPLAQTQLTSCTHYETTLTQAFQTQDLKTLGDLLPTLKRNSDCSGDYLTDLQRQMSDLAATYARHFLNQGQPEEAKKWLTFRYAPVNVWQTQMVRGDLAWQGKQWEDAALFYNQALDLLNDPKAVLTPPSLAEKQRVYQLAAETQLLTGRLITMRDNCSATGVLQNVTGLQIVERPLPIQFKFGTTELTADGQAAAEKLACYLTKHRPRQVTLIGHTDRVNSDELNCDFSKRRALALQAYLMQHGNPSYQIRTLGKGKRQPMKLVDPSHYTQDQIDQINRRVEFAMDKEVSGENVCE